MAENDTSAKEAELAKAVKDAVSALNAAISEAAKVGLTVEINQHNMMVVGLASEWPVLNASVKRIHVTRY